MTNAPQDAPQGGASPHVLTPSQAIRAAAELIASRGLARGHYADGRKLCIMGALRVACGSNHPDFVPRGIDFGLYDMAYCAVSRNIPAIHGGLLADFNDHALDAEQVSNWLRAVADLVEANPDGRSP